MIIEASREEWDEIDHDDLVHVCVHLKGSDKLVAFQKDITDEFLAVSKMILHKQDELARRAYIRLLKAYYGLAENNFVRASQTTLSILEQVSPKEQRKIFAAVFDQDALHFTFNISKERARPMVEKIEGTFADEICLALPPAPNEDYQAFGDPCLGIFITPTPWVFYNPQRYKGEIQVIRFTPDDIQGSRFSALDAWANGSYYFSPQYFKETIKAPDLPNHMTAQLRPRLDKLSYW